MRHHNSSNLFARLFTGENRWLFLIASILLTGVTTAAYDAVLSVFGDSLLVLVGIAVVSGVVLWVIVRIWGARIQRSLQHPSQVYVEKDRKAPKQRALVVFVGPGPDKPHLSAVEHHYHGDEAGVRLEYFWYVYTREAAFRNQELLAKFPNATAHPVRLRHADDVPSAYDAVLAAIDGALRLQAEPPLAETDLIVDITGGTKSMTAGAVLACRERSVSVQYMLGQRDGEGKLIRDRDGRVRSDAMKVELIRATGGPDTTLVEPDEKLAAAGDARPVP